jgi:hypothetical protein
MDNDLAEVAKLVPEGLKWSVGTGTKRSHAQILPEGLIGRCHSFYATADTEADALREAAEQARVWVREMHAKRPR